MSAALCECCLAFSGIYRKANRCCQIRMLANMPKEMRRGEYDRIGATSGREALAETIALVKAEYLRGQSRRAEK